MVGRVISVSTSPPTSGAEDDLNAALNPNSMTVIPNARIEPALAADDVGTQEQFERLGYFCVDPDSQAERLVFNRTVTLRDSWARIEKEMARKAGGD